MKFALIVFFTFVSFCLTANPLGGAPSGDFDYWVLACEWQPQWMISTCQHAGSKPLLTNPNNFNGSSFGASYPSLHGLWPNYDAATRDGYTWPQYCVEDGIDFQQCQRTDYAEKYCQPTTESLREFNTSKRWMSYAPEFSYSTLAAHEWSKHGSCTGWTQEYYYTQTEDLYIRLGSGKGFAYVAANVGQEVSYKDLYDAFAYDTNQQQLSLQCSSSCQFSEVWTAWGVAEGTLIPTDPIPLSDEDTCQKCLSIEILAYTGC